MDKQQLSVALQKSHQAFIKELNGLSETDFNTKPGDKWTAGQQLDHIIKSVKPLNMAFGLPKFVLKSKFGVANRPSRTYDELVAKYQKALNEIDGKSIPSDFAPNEIAFNNKEKSFEALNKLIQKLCKRFDAYSEERLDTYILPHPLIGKVTLREMLYFTNYHVQHHQKQISENLMAMNNGAKS